MYPEIKIAQISKNQVIKGLFLIALIVFSSCKEKVVPTENTVPKSLAVIPDYTKATTLLSKREKIGQFFMPAAYINDSEEEIQRLEKLIKEENIGALCFFKSRISAAANFDDSSSTDNYSVAKLKVLIKRYQKAAKHPLLIAIDAEWGLAMRVENTPQYPYAITLGAMQDHHDLIYEVGRNIANDCKEAGVHWNLSPVVDINNNPNNPVIGYRSFGEDKFLVTAKAIAYLKGMQSEGVLGCLKHFPGHGDTATDSHIGLPVIEKTKEELLNNELFPFQQLIKKGVESVMIGHLAVPALTGEKNTPTTLSEKTIKGVLRGEMNFDKVVISDALNMRSVSKLYPTKGELEWVAFNAGNDVLCFAENPKEGIETILKNATENQIEESFKRIWKLKEKVFNTSIPGTKERFTEDSLNAKIANQSLTMLKGDKNTLLNFKADGFVGIEISKNTDNSFFQFINKELNSTSFSSSERTIAQLKKEISTQENVVLAIYPPAIKPTDNFGLSTEELHFISEITATKNVVLYIFGNPYILNILEVEKAKNTIIAFQDFEVFQENAAAHFLGKTEAKGKLSVSIN
ncbi:glycoside hydrolase family 3 protein [Cellulophaga sp. F20128]|uniref:glycoside hydrolase family 3 protein n=1 Tax=Cellulophaga sp. F20128 TaxID=2926413 RepID=UPI001FF3FCDA|nr:glycoside hydrolase family 3 protein [Cellulophaga sp. F20128]MCK0157594.1 glycoside hydrolase family 3 protein [Cellulophaga sp. F20128]